MKETERIETPENDKVVIEQNVQKQAVFLGSQQKIKGLTMFEFDPFKMTLEPAEYKASQIEFIKYPSGYDPSIISPQYETVHKLVPKPGCIYIQALNKRNAFKKIAKKYKNFKLKN